MQPNCPVTAGMGKRREAVGGQAQPRMSWAEGSNMKTPSQDNSLGPHATSYNRRRKSLSLWYQSWSKIFKCFCLRKKGFGENMLAESFRFSQKVCVHTSVEQVFHQGKETPVFSKYPNCGFLYLEVRLTLKKVCLRPKSCCGLYFSLLTCLHCSLN